MGSNFELIAAMALFAFVTSITPGPNNMMLLASGVNFGLRRSIPHLLGISGGHFIMLILVGAGLDALLALHPAIYQVMKVLGFAYLLYLVWGIAKSAAPQSSDTGRPQPLSFIGAAAFQWVNPKAWIMALGYFSNFMPADASMVFIVVTCLMFSLVNFPCIVVWVVLGEKLERYLKSDRSRKTFNWVMALLLFVSMIPAFLI